MNRHSLVELLSKNITKQAEYCATAVFTITDQVDFFTFSTDLYQKALSALQQFRFNFPGFFSFSKVKIVVER